MTTTKKSAVVPFCPGYAQCAGAFLLVKLNEETVNKKSEPNSFFSQ